MSAGPGRALGIVRAFVTATFRTMFAERSTLFFTVVLPIGIITIIGTSYGGVLQADVAVIGAEDSAFVDRLAAELAGGEGVQLVDGVTEDDARRQIRRFDLSLAVLVPDDVDATLARGETPELRYLANDADPERFATLGVIQSALDQVTGPSAAARALVEADPSGELTMDRAMAAVTDAPGSGGGGDSVGSTPLVERITVGDRGFADASPFSLTAAQNLVLFTFITCVTSAPLLVRSRRQGILGRAMASPAGSGLISLGLAATWFLLALLQSVLIVGVGAVAFGVEWGDPVAAAALVVVFAAMGAGAALLAGAAFGSEERLGAASPPIGLVLGALGGCMVPSEFFPDSIRNVATAVPHFWAMEGWETVLFDGGTVADIGGPLAILVVFTAGFLGLGTVVLHRSLTAGGR